MFGQLVRGDSEQNGWIDTAVIGTAGIAVKKVDVLMTRVQVTAFKLLLGIKGARYAGWTGESHTAPPARWRQMDAENSARSAAWRQPRVGNPRNNVSCAWCRQ